MGLCRTSAPHIASQPFYLSRYLPTLPQYDEFERSPSAKAWLEKSTYIEDAYTVLIEWLRSRLGGYPFLEAPQLAHGSPWTSFNVSMQVPWFVGLRERQLHKKATPPTIPFLGIDAATQLIVGARLGAAIASSPAANEVGAAWRSLTAVDEAELRSACTTIAHAQYPEPADVTGNEDFRELGWAETTLSEAMRSLPSRAKRFTDALIAADRLIQQAAILFGQLIVYGEIRQLSGITLVEQLDGANGWNTVCSESLVMDQIRLAEILAFDHPYPRGVMLVAGTKEKLTNAPIDDVTTVHGWILPDSEKLVSVIPISQI